MRRGGPASHPATTEQIVDLRDQGMTWSEVAKHVDMRSMEANCRPASRPC
jgi:hypothetical protein